MTNIKPLTMKNRFHIATALIVAYLSGPVLAQTETAAPAAPDSKMKLLLSPYTLHFTQDDEHKDVLMVGLEREYPTGKLDGAVFFTNSFGQPSVYIFPWGQIYHSIWGVKPLSFKWTAGLLYGYKEPYENKVPLNYKGFSPGAIIALEYEFQSGWSAQVDMLGTAGLMFQLNKSFK
jgi:hypothetical protein